MIAAIGAWRGPLGDSGILDFFLGVLAVDGLRQGLQVHSLRLVGNSCADTDENRAKVVEGNHLASIIRHLEYEKLIPFTIPVLFNILVDYGKTTPELLLFLFLAGSFHFTKLLLHHFQHT